MSFLRFKSWNVASMLGLADMSGTWDLGSFVKQPKSTLGELLGEGSLDGIRAGACNLQSHKNFLNLTENVARLQKEVVALAFLKVA